MKKKLFAEALFRRSRQAENELQNVGMLDKVIEHKWSGGPVYWNAGVIRGFETDYNPENPNARIDVKESQYKELGLKLAAMSENMIDMVYEGMDYKLFAKPLQKTAVKLIPDSDLFIDDGLEFEDSNVCTAYSEQEMERYLENVQQLGKAGSLEKVRSELGKTSEKAQDVFAKLEEVRKSFEVRKRQAFADDSTGIKLPAFGKKELAELSKACENYFEYHGIQDTKENKLIRDIAKHASRAESFEKKDSKAQLSVDADVKNRLVFLKNRLDQLSGSLTGNSKEFDALYAIAHKVADSKEPTEEEFKKLQDAAKLYMEEKGQSKRSTSKGQLRYDIAGDIFALASDVTGKETTEKDLDAAYKVANGRERKSGSRTKVSMDALQTEAKKDSKKTAQVKPAASAKDMKKGM